MLFADLDLPVELLRAQDENKLVIFAGAGVSMGPPSNLPGFECLAKEIGGKSVDPESAPRLDVYLGGLKEEGVEVHEEAARILGASDSQPNGLHRNLLRIFESLDRVRLVTTNHDRHFETAAAEIWPDDQLEVWKAPGLPTGHDFQGLGYLHGRLGGPSERLVLTDEDFGRAYLIEGWARRFLVDLFASSYTVLFVGYSHSDTVLSYMARGLPPTGSGQRFVLTDEDKPSRWQSLRIQAIRYPSTDSHGPLYDAVRDWASHCEKSALAHEAYVKEILVRKPEAANDRDLDRLSWYWDHPDYWRFLLEHATDADWFTWLHGAGALKVLRDKVESLGDRSYGLVVWIAKRSAVDDNFSTKALQWFRSLSDPLPVGTWEEVVRKIDFQWSEEDNETQERRARLLPWLCLLLGRRPEGTTSFAFNFTINTLDPAENAELVLLFFDHLTDIRYDKREGFPGVDVVGDAEILKQSWSRWRDQVDLLADAVLVIGERHLRKLRWISGPLDSAENNVNLLRTSIVHDDSDGLNHGYHGIDTLLDAVGDALEWAVQNRGTEATELCRRWVGSSAILLRRLGLHGLKLSGQLSGGDKLALVLDRNLLEDPEAHREARKLVEAAYSEAGAGDRSRLLQHVRTILVDDVEESEDLDSRVRTLSFFLKDLQAADPSCELVVREVSLLKKDFPEFNSEPLPRLEEPDFPTAETLLGLDSEAVIELLDDLFERTGGGDQGFLPSISRSAEVAKVIQDSAHKDLDWALSLARTLRDLKRLDSPLWRPLLQAWESSRLPVARWQELMSFFSIGLPSRDFDVQTATLLERRLKQVGEDGLDPSSFLEPALGVANRIFSRSTREDDRSDNGNQDWLGIAIGRPAGTVALFVLAALGALRNADAVSWWEDVEDLRVLTEALLDAPKPRSELGRPVLASQLSFFYFHQPRWAENRLLPLFSWERDPRAASQAWDGFIFWGRFSRRLWEDLLPHLVETFGYLDRLEESRSIMLSRNLAGPAFALSADPVEEGWLSHFLSEADEKQRCAWAGGVLEVLASLNAEQKSAAWNNWLRRHVEERLAGRPSLKKKEWAAMHEWALYFEDDFPEFVDLLEKRPVQPPNLDFLAYLCGQVSGRGSFDREALFRSPDALVRYLIHLLENPPSQTWYLRNLEACLERLGESDVEIDLLGRLVNRQRKLGGTVPEALRSRFEKLEEE